MSNKDTKLIQKYISNLLSEDEKIRLEDRINTEPKLKEQYELFKEMEQHIELKLKNKKALETLNKFNQTEKQKIKKNSFLKKVQISIASLAALFLISFFILNNQAKKSTQLYAEYFSPEIISINSKTTIDASEINTAHKMYLEQDYINAIKLFKKNEINLTPPSQLAFAISLMENNESDKSKVILKQLESIPLYDNSAYWYQAMIELKLDNLVGAKTQLVKIDEESSYYQNAQKILSEI